ncbi:hypothetical protein [Nocardia tengchongensis]|uniref:hypothetical protein n=1 Tax=Nocardia tengchongensis TaxID=2055889 RepID=UPI0036663B6B
MDGSSQGSAYPSHGTAFEAENDPGYPDFDQAVAQITTSMNELAAQIAPLNAGQCGKSWSLPVDKDREAQLPTWRGPKHWLAMLKAALSTDEGQAVVRRHHTSADTVLEISAVNAAAANRATGRRMTLAKNTIGARAKFSKTSVERTRRVQRDLGFAEEMARGRVLRGVEFHAAQAHHGGAQSKAASVWHLILPAGAAAIVEAVRGPRCASASMGPCHRVVGLLTRSGKPGPQPPAPANTPVNRRDALSQTNHVLGHSYVGNNSPTHAHTRAETKPRHKKPERLPRSGALQRVTAEFLAHCHGLDRGAGRNGWHIGSVCDVIAAAGIDLARYSGRDLAIMIDRDSAARGWTWPNRVDNAAAFLRARFALMNFDGPSPSEQARSRAEAASAAHELRARQRDEDNARLQNSDPARIAAARALIADVLRRPKWHTDRTAQRTPVAPQQRVAKNVGALRSPRAAVA